jgi:hypothetical protein
MRALAEALTASIVRGWRTVRPAPDAMACGSPISRWPAMRPTSRTPIPNTRPMVCGFIPDYDGISGNARLVSASYLIYRSC